MEALGSPWNHLEPLWRLFATSGSTFCHFGDFLPNLVALFCHINFIVYGSTSVNSFLTVLMRKCEFRLFFDIFCLLLVNLRGLKHAPDNLLQHGTIHVSIPQAVREEIAHKQPHVFMDIYTNSTQSAGVTLTQNNCPAKNSFRIHF